MCREFRLAGSVSSVSQGFLSAPPPPPRCSSLGGTGPHSLPAFEISVLVRNALALLSLTSPTVRQLMDRAEASSAARARGVQPGVSAVRSEVGSPGQALGYRAPRAAAAACRARPQAIQRRGARRVTLIRPPRPLPAAEPPGQEAAALPSAIEHTSSIFSSHRCCRRDRIKRPAFFKRRMSH